jgi:hypothetical protein
MQKTDLLNRVFYLATYVTSTACNSVRPKRPTIAALNVEGISDALFENCYEWIDAEFKLLGGDDRVAKGSQLTASLKAKLITEFGRGQS